jgi:hypothetical protein
MKVVLRLTISSHFLSKSIVSAVLPTKIKTELYGTAENFKVVIIKPG